jgi:release factor glutamine methyltransferase
VPSSAANRRCSRKTGARSDTHGGVERTCFYGLRLATRPGRVMTPRAASEQLVARALELVRDRPARVADVGTGSGAVAIAIGAAAPRVEVWATDTSRCAVALARFNVRRHGLDPRVTVRQGDLLEPVPGSFELIVANLPYLPRAAAARHPDLEAEPSEAVFADGDGLEPYRRLLAASTARLTVDGALAIQLRRRVVVARRHQLAPLRAALEGPERLTDALLQAPAQAAA